MRRCHSFFLVFSAETAHSDAVSLRALGGLLLLFAFQVSIPESIATLSYTLHNVKIDGTVLLTLLIFSRRTLQSKFYPIRDS